MIINYLYLMLKYNKLLKLYDYCGPIINKTCEDINININEHIIKFLNYYTKNFYNYPYVLIFIDEFYKYLQDQENLNINLLMLNNGLIKNGIYDYPKNLDIPEDLEKMKHNVLFR